VKTIPFREARDRWMQDPEFKREYDALDEEFAILEACIVARSRSGLTQAQVAERLGVSQPAVARIESGKNVSLKTLRRYARALGCTVKIELKPMEPRAGV